MKAMDTWEIGTMIPDMLEYLSVALSVFRQLVLQCNYCDASLKHSSQFSWWSGLQLP